MVPWNSGVNALGGRSIFAEPGAARCTSDGFPAQRAELDGESRSLSSNRTLRHNQPETARSQASATREFHCWNGTERLRSKAIVRKLPLATRVLKVWG